MATNGFGRVIRRHARWLAPVLTAVIVVLAWAIIPSTKALALPASDGWCTVLPPVGSLNVQCGISDPVAACQVQYTAWTDHSPTFEGASPSGDKWYIYQCAWSITGVNPRPASVDYECASSTQIALPLGRCVDQAENVALTDCKGCSANNSGTRVARTPNPIDILTGAETLTATDFETADRSLQLNRSFSSVAYSGGPSDSNNTVSQAMVNLPIGLANWLFDFQYELQFTVVSWSGKKVMVLAPSGRIYPFTCQFDGSMVPATDHYAFPQTDYSLSVAGGCPYGTIDISTSPTTWILHDPDDNVWTLTTVLDPTSGSYRVGRPTSMVSRNGHQWTFHYGSLGELQTITDNAKTPKSITFHWVTVTYHTTFGTATLPRTISQIDLPGGYQIKYTYQGLDGSSGIDRLYQVQFVDPSSVVQDQTTYQYTDAAHPSAVTGILDKDGTLRWSIAYDAKGRATSSSGPSGAFAYSVTNYDAIGAAFTRTLTNPLGKTFVYHYATTSGYLQLMEIDGQASTTTPATTVSFTYDPTTKFLASMTDEEGRLMNYTRNSRGLPTQIDEGVVGTSFQRRTAIGWENANNVPASITVSSSTQDYLTKAYHYDSGLLTSLTLTDDTNLEPIGFRDRVWTYTWCATGQQCWPGELKTVDGPLGGNGDKITYGYTADGYLQKITNEVGLVTEVLERDWRGAPLTVEDPNDVRTAFTYDIHGRVLTAKVNHPASDESVYTFEYTPMGDIAKITLPEGGWLQYTYDGARRLTTITNNRGQTQTFINDANGAATSQTIKAADATTTFQQTADYDDLGRILHLIGAGTGQTTTFGYDKVSNLTDVTDALTHAFHTDYDLLNRPSTETDPLSHSVQYGYDPLDDLTIFTDGLNHQTTRMVSGFGDVIQETSPDRGTWHYEYDLGGRLTKQTDANGVVTNFTYDDSGRRLTATFPSSTAENIAYTYDDTTGGNHGKGRLTHVADQTGTTDFFYDAQGRVTSATKVIAGSPNQTYATAYSYDRNGKVTSVTLPSGRIVTYTRASDGLATKVTTTAPGGTAQNVATSVAYKPFGPLASFTYGNGLNLTRSFDQNYWMSGVNVSATGAARLDLTFGRNGNGALTGVTDNNGSTRNASYSYYNDQRLNTGNGAWGNRTFSYDAAGNLTQIVAGAVTTAINVASTNNRVTTVTNNGTTARQFTYDNNGSVTVDQRTGVPSYQYGYNARGRLATSTKNTSTAAGAYGYDAFDSRVTRQTFGTGAFNRHYIFDAEGHLWAEHDAATGAVVREYIWLDDMPLAMVDYSSGTAKTYYIHTGQIGEPLMMTRNNQNVVWDNVMDPYGTATPLGTDSVALDLRYPGQWLQSETGGLAQNWYRDYDASLGRYAEVDPSGLRGGINVYAYGAERPTTTIDPTALDTVVLLSGYGPPVPMLNFFGHTFVTILDTKTGIGIVITSGQQGYPPWALCSNLAATDPTTNRPVELQANAESITESVELARMTNPFRAPEMIAVKNLGSTPYSQVVLKAFADIQRVNSTHIPYQPLGPGNSNAFAAQVYRDATGEDVPFDPRFPGLGDSLPNCPCQ